MELMTSYERKGELKGTQDFILRFLKTKFGSDADTLQKHIRSINDSALLEDVLDKLFAAASLDEAQEIIKQAAQS